jgi:xanthine dehydrogenase accessory factor
VSLSFWRQALSHVEAGESVFLAHVVANGRHSPGTRGASLGVRAGGASWGTIGGGIMEARIVEEGLEALSASSFSPRLETLHHRSKADGKLSGLMCAGHQTNLYQICRPSDAGLLGQIVALLEADAPGELVYSSDGMRLNAHIGPSADQPPLFLEAPNGAWQVREQLLNWKRVAIIGGGHCGLALSRVMAQLGYTVTVFETRKDVFTFRDNLYARHRIVVDDYAEAGPLIGAPEWTHVVVMTADYPSDVRGLIGTVQGPFLTVGVMGAPAKLTRIKAALREAGVDDEALAALRAPIGLPMESNTPEEIAISVAAQILQERRALFARKGKIDVVESDP